MGAGALGGRYPRGRCPRQVPRGRYPRGGGEVPEAGTLEVGVLSLRSCPRG